MTSRVGRGVASAARRVALLSAAATATTPRPTPARPDNIVADYFYSHVAKTGGGSFAKMVEKGRLRPLRPCHVPLHTLRCARQRCDVALNGRGAPCVASSEGHLKNVALDPRVKLWISAREPFAHVVSLYAHCQQPGAAGKRRHAFPNATLSEFIDVFYSRGGVAPAKYCSYDPRNFATRYLGDGDVARATRVVDEADWVLVTDAFGPSLCWLRSMLAGRRACGCDGFGALRRKTHGTRTDLIDVPPALEWRIRELTRDDARVYARARARLRDGLAGYNLTCLLDV